jgi:Ca2+-binding RTX toxin-like protein
LRPYSGGSGTDTLTASDDGDFALRSFGSSSSIEVIDGGTTESDIRGDNANNTLDFRNTELRNIDEIDAGGGNDNVLGGSANDRIDGGSGNDRLSGQAGDDSLDGGKGNDVLLGDDGADSLTGGSGNDQLFGGNNADVLNGGSGDDRLSGDAGDDILDGGSGDDQLSGGSGDDILTGGSGNDRLSGGDGADTLIGGKGDDVLDGGAGNDLFIFRESQGDDVVHGREGWLDTVRLEDRNGESAEESSWEIDLDRGSIEGEMDDYIELSNDASGTITFGDGSELVFDGIERIEW